MTKNEELTKKLYEVAAAWNPKLIDVLQGLQNIHFQICELAEIERQLRSLYKEIEEPKPKFDEQSVPMYADLWRMEVVLQEVINAGASGNEAARNRIKENGILVNRPWAKEFEGKDHE